MNIRSFTASLLALLTVFSCAACASGTSDNAADTTAADTTAADVTTSEPTNEDLLSAAKAALPEKDFEGANFIIVDRQHVDWETIDVYYETATGDPINDAVYERNTILEEKFNIKVVERKVEGPAAAVTKEILAGDDTFDTVTDGLNALAKNLATAGYIYDFNEIPNMDMSQPYWDQMMNAGLSISEKIYFATGDISIMDNYGTWAMMFNKDMLNDFSLDDPYTLVNDGAWTLDKFYDMAKVASLDLDGDGVMGDWDQYGFLTEQYNAYGLWACTGESITTKNSDDLPELSMFNDRSVAVIEKVIPIQADKITSISGDRHSKAMAEGVNEIFKQGGGLFIFGGLWLISEYRASEVNFGIIPAPKFDENQDQYYSTYSYGNCTAYSVPITVGDLEKVGTVMESMAILSQYTLTPAYYDITLEGKFLRDDESAGMIDIVLDTRNFDLAPLFNWGGAFDVFYYLHNNASIDIASQYAAIEEKAQIAINEFLELISEQ